MVFKLSLLFCSAILALQLLSVAVAAQSANENENVELSGLSKAKDQQPAVPSIRVSDVKPNRCSRECFRGRNGKRYCTRVCRRGRRDLSVQNREGKANGVEFSSSDKAKSYQQVIPPIPSRGHCKKRCFKRNGKRVCRLVCSGK